MQITFNVRRRLRRSAVVGTVATLALALGACATTPPGPVEPDEVISLRIGYIPAITAGGIPAIALSEGLFDEENLDVELIPFTSGPAQAAAMAGGSLDIEYLGGPAIWNAAKGGGKIIGLSDISYDAFILAQPSSGITSIADLAGKTVGVTLGNSSEFIFQEAIDAAGVDRTSIQVVNVDPPTAVTAFVSGQIDAVATFFPFAGAIKAEVPGAVELATSRDFPQYALTGVYVASDELLASNPEAIDRFNRVMVAAAAIRATDRELAVKVTAELTGTPAETLDAQYDLVDWLDPQETLDFYESGDFVSALWTLQTIMVEIGALPAPVDPREFIDLDSNTKALQEYLAADSEG